MFRFQHCEITGQFLFSLAIENMTSRNMSLRFHVTWRHSQRPTTTTTKGEAAVECSAAFYFAVLQHFFLSPSGAIVHRKTLRHNIITWTNTCAHFNGRGTKMIFKFQWSSSWDIKKLVFIVSPELGTQCEREHLKNVIWIYFSFPRRMTWLNSDIKRENSFYREIHAALSLMSYRITCTQRECLLHCVNFIVAGRPEHFLVCSLAH